MALPEGYSFTPPEGRIYDMGSPPPGFAYAYGPNGERQAVPRDSRANSPAIGGGMANGQMLPVLSAVDRTEVLSDPALRELYFGSPDYPGLISEARRAAQQTFLDQPAILRQTAGLSPLETAAIQQAYGGIGGYEPYLQAQEEAILGGLGTIGSQRGLSRASLRGFDPTSIGGFYNPFEQQVVQQTIQDVMKGGALQDIQQRAADIARGGESAFGSRARLGAAERQAALGKGLGEALAQIRAGGYGQALGAAQRESEFGRGALQRAAEFERGVGQELAGYGRELGGLGATYQQLGQQQRQELMGLGAVPRQLMETRLGREYEQQVAQRQAPIQAMQYIQGFAPQYQAGQTQIAKQYREPRSPLAEGLGAFFSTYGALAPQQQGSGVNIYAGGQGGGQQQTGGYMTTGYMPSMPSYGGYQQAPSYGGYQQAPQSGGGYIFA